MDVDLVFEGGGVLGIGYVGALKALEENGYTPKRCAGTSAGSILAALTVAGYTSRELMDVLNKTDFKMFMEKTMFDKIFIIGKPLSLIINKGIYSSEIIESYVSELLKQKGITKFKDVMVNGKSMLKIIASDITMRKMLILPDDLKYYGINPYEFSIAKAIRMSCAVPFYFTPVTLEHRNKISYIVDGGLLSNFPIWIFDMDEPLDRPTIGIKVKDADSYTSYGKKDIISYLRDIINAPIQVDEENFIRRKDRVRIAIIDYHFKISATDFYKSNKVIRSLCDNGYNSVINFINTRKIH